MEERTTSTGKIRAIRLRQDLVQIADLIELCFAQNIDAEGRDYIRHIRQTARNFSGLILDNSTPENSSLPFNGYVWEENGEIIGNLTLIPLRKRQEGSYFVANVAVHPSYRGRGIGRQLTERALRHVREHKGRYIFLQVREDNAVAVNLYTTLGFEEFSRRTMWVYQPNRKQELLVPTNVQVTGRIRDDWPQQRVWLQSIYPPEISWNMPFQLDRCEPSLSNWLTRLFNSEQQRTWAARRLDNLIGTVTLDRCNEVHDYLWIASSPLWEDATIQAILPVIQRKVFFPHRLAVNYPAGRGRDSFLAVGMSEVNTLIWMKNRIYPEGQSVEIRL